MRGTRTRLWALLVALLLAGLFWWVGTGDEQDPGATDPAGLSSAVQGDPGTDTGSDTGSEEPPVHDEAGIAYVPLEDLPPEAADTVARIDAGGPFEHAGKDGSTFGNFEGHLPERRRGYYREYTVETPGLSHRGARRIVTGAEGEFYWTDDHYESFERIWR